jgi:hypothetical protein
MAIQRENTTSDETVQAFLERLTGIEGVLAIDASWPDDALEGWHVFVDSEEAQVAVIESELAEYQSNLDFPIEVHSYVVEPEDAASLRETWTNAPSLIYLRR